MRTIEEISARVEDGKKQFLNFGLDVLTEYLPDPELDGKPHTFSGYGPPSGKTYPLDPDDRETIVEAMRHYAAFGWGKVEDHRGLSAGRTIQKMREWLWLLGDDETSDKMDDPDLYPWYGAPALALVCRKYGFEIPGHLEHMAAPGTPCAPGCRSCAG